MRELDATLKDSLLDRLESLGRARHRSSSQLLEEALRRYLDQEEHAEEMYRAYGGALDRGRRSSARAA